MKRCFMILVSVAAMIASADIVSAQVKFGAGYSMGRHNYTVGDKVTPYDLHGFNVGLTYDANFIDWNIIEFGVVTGINYEMLTDQKSEESDLFKAKVKKNVSEHYINVPLQLNLGLNIIPGIFGVYAYAGPLLSFGVASNTDFSIDFEAPNMPRGKLSYNNYNGKFKVENVSDAIAGSITNQIPSDYGWFDVKLGAGVGIEIADAIDLKAGYNWGLINRYTGDNDSIKHLSDQFYITLSYIF